MDEKLERLLKGRTPSQVIHDVLFDINRVTSDLLNRESENNKSKTNHDKLFEYKGD